jgi:hypothetical protein
MTALGKKIPLRRKIEEARWQLRAIYGSWTLPPLTSYYFGSIYIIDVFRHKTATKDNENAHLYTRRASFACWGDALLLLASGWGQGPHRHPHDTEGEDDQEAEACKLRHRPDSFAEQNGRGAERADTLAL